MKYTITIPEPCHENWHNMTPTAKGKFCGSCEKEVVDFSTNSIAALSKKLDSGSKLCGRFRPDQLNRTIRSGKGNAIRQRGVLVAAVALLASTSPAFAQSPNSIPIPVEPTEMILGRIAVQPNQTVKPIAKEYVTITGMVRSGQSLVEGAEIRIKGSRIKTKSDAKGKFEILVKAEKMNPSLVLQVSHVDYEVREVEVHQIDTPVDIDLFYNGMIMGDIMIEENPTIIDRIGNGFRKKK